MFTIHTKLVVASNSTRLEFYAILFLIESAETHYLLQNLKIYFNFMKANG